MAEEEKIILIWIKVDKGEWGGSKGGVGRFIQLTRLVTRDCKDPRWVTLKKAVLEYQEEQVATTAKKGKKRSRTQLQNPETRIEEQER